MMFQVKQRCYAGKLSLTLIKTASLHSHSAEWKYLCWDRKASLQAVPAKYTHHQGKGTEMAPVSQEASWIGETAAHPSSTEGSYQESTLPVYGMEQRHRAKSRTAIAIE